MPKSLDVQIEDLKRQIKEKQEKLKKLEDKKVSVILKSKNISDKKEVIAEVKKGKPTEDIIINLKK
ncbi:MAG: hypothetical protein RSA27_00105 [Oscillospiraceae bacterium]